MTEPTSATIPTLPAVEDEPGFECAVCYNVAQLGTACHDCGDLICGDCEERGTFTMWQSLEISLYCSRCRHIICDECAIFCYSCANRYDGSKEILVYCDGCVPDDVKPVDCPHHTWYKCSKKHTNHGYTAPDEDSDTANDPDGGCEECRANRNYDGRYGGWD